jgi:hypothetical protein
MRCSHCGGSFTLPADPFFDDERRSVIVAGERRPVTSQAYRVLEILRQRAGRRVSKEYIYDHLPGSPSLRAVNVYLHRARRALAGTPYCIETLYGGDLVLTRGAQAQVPAPSAVAVALPPSAVPPAVVTFLKRIAIDAAGYPLERAA